MQFNFYSIVKKVFVFGIFICNRFDMHIIETLHISSQHVVQLGWRGQRGRDKEKHKISIKVKEEDEE